MFKPGSWSDCEGVFWSFHTSSAALAPVVTGADVDPGPEVGGAGVEGGDWEPEAEDRQEDTDQQHCEMCGDWAGHHAFYSETEKDNARNKFLRIILSDIKQ